MLIDAGLGRRRALGIVAGIALVCGLPSALSIPFFQNQDWVWGVGLMLSGLLFALGARAFGIERMRREVVNAEGADLRIGAWWSFVVGVLVPVEAVVLMVWLLWDVASSNPDHWLSLSNPFSVGWVLLEWAVALVVLIALNRWLRRHSGASAAEADGGIEG